MRARFLDVTSTFSFTNGACSTNDRPSTARWPRDTRGLVTGWLDPPSFRRPYGRCRRDCVHTVPHSLDLRGSADIDTGVGIEAICLEHHEVGLLVLACGSWNFCDLSC
jgi:hypothetical protein